MEAIALALGALLAIACVLVVARPLVRPAPPEGDALVGPGADRRLRLLEERDRALAALKELEFDHRTGKVSDEDYRAAVGRLRGEAAQALKALELEDRPKRERASVDVHG
jgi:hypothetical protein